MATSGAQAAPGTAYVAFDVLRLDPTKAIAVTFALKPASGAAVATSTVTLTAAQIAAAQTAAQASGVPYLYATWKMGAGIAKATYSLVTTVNGTALSSTPAFTIN